MTNATGARLAECNDDVEFGALERLPRTLRRALQEAMLPYSCKQISLLLRQAEGDVGAILDLLERDEAFNIAHLAAAYQTQWGQPYPHLAAGATIQRGGYA